MIRGLSAVNDIHHAAQLRGCKGLFCGACPSPRDHVGSAAGGSAPGRDNRRGRVNRRRNSSPVAMSVERAAALVTHAGGKDSGFRLPRWHIQHVTGLALPKLSAPIFLTISIMRRAASLAGLSSFSNSLGTWQVSHCTPSHREKFFITSGKRAAGTDWKTCMFL